MKRTILILIIISCLIFAYFSFKTRTNSDGFIVSEKPWGNIPEKYLEVSFSRIRTMSDGLEVVALLGKPKNMTKNKYPVIIFNRGGNREFAKIERQIVPFYEFVKHGYIVLASQYRGNDGSEGKEQFGGDDVHDVLNLIKTAHNLSFADIDNIYMAGMSRGGMMTYLALKEQPPIKAAVVIAGSTDLFADAKERPGMEKKVMKELIPNFDQNRDEEYKKRSVLFWPEKINVPLLIIHGKADRYVNINQAYALVDKLKNLDKNFKFIEHEEGHIMTPEIIKNTINWFKNFA